MRGNGRIAARLAETPATLLCISPVTEGEVRFGLAKHGGGHARAAAIDALFATLEVLPWTRKTAAGCGRFRADLQRLGRLLAPLDIRIAAHALEAGAVLVTFDRALLGAPRLASEDRLA